MGKNETNNPEITQESLDALRAELEAAKAATPQAIEQATLPLKERIASLEAEVGSKTQDIEVLKAKLSDGEKSFASLTASLEGAVTAYKSAVLKANPMLPPELITGITIAEVDTSVDKATAIVGKIKEGLAQQNQQVSIPAGAPGRTPPDTSTLSPKEKLMLGLNARRKEKS